MATKPPPKATSPSHLPTTTAERRTGRARTASAIPDSNSPARTGPARNAVPSAAIRLRPNITRLSTEEALFEADPPGLHRVHAHAEGDQVGHEVRHRGGVLVGGERDGEPIAVAS